LPYPCNSGIKNYSNRLAYITSKLALLEQARTVKKMARVNKKNRKGGFSSWLII
jgi:hypothetical protein